MPDNGPYDNWRDPSEPTIEIIHLLARHAHANARAEAAEAEAERLRGIARGYENWRDRYHDRPFKPLGYHGPTNCPALGWRAWLRGAPSAYLGCRRSMNRRTSVAWVWRARP